MCNLPSFIKNSLNRLAQFRECAVSFDRLSCNPARLPELTRKNDAYYYQKEQYGKAKNNQAEVQGR